MVYDGFNGSSGTLQGNGGGTGWGGAVWYNSGNVNYATPGLTYSSLEVSGNKAVAGGSDSGVFRYMNQGTLGDGTVTYWLSFLAQSSASGTSYGGLSLYTESSDERFFIGQRNNQSSFGIERNGGPSGNSSTASSSLSLLVIRLDFTPSGESARLWINPALDSTPTDDSAAVTLTGLSDFTFNTVRIQSGSSTQFSVDELRFGNTFADVTPVPEPTTVALGIFGSLALVGLVIRQVRAAGTGSFRLKTLADAPSL